MNKFINTGKWLLCVLGTVPLVVPLTAGAQAQRAAGEAETRREMRTRDDAGARDRGDVETRARDNDEAWQQGQAELQRQLQPGQPANAYRKKIEELGYQVTSVNYDEDDYLEYEVVKGDQTYEVQLDVNEDTGRVEAVDIAMNVWRTEATEQALEQNRAAGRTMATAARRANPYSDRDRARSEQLISELEALPTGRDKQFYKNELQRRGYEITKVNTDDQDELSLEAVKQGQSVELNVSFDEDSGRSTAIDADSLWMESEATTQARERQERSPARAGSGASREAERRSQTERQRSGY
jgi:hypothetical protein